MISYIFMQGSHLQYKLGYWNMQDKLDRNFLFMCKAGRGIQSWDGEINMHFNQLAIL